VKTVILAGGLGTRMREETEYRPKPMVPIGSQPILWHIMKLYASFNHKDFVVCTGYKSEMIRQYFRDFETSNLDFTISIGNRGVLTSHEELNEVGWNVTIADTGTQTMTGGRILKAQKYLGSETFMCTYGDGLADVDLSKLLKFHKSHGKIATMSSVRPVSRFGVVDISSTGKVEGFREKPQTESWVNAGYFVFEPKIFNYLDDECVLEEEPLNNLSKDGELMAYKHEGFWQPMDTYRESIMLNQLWNEGNAPWKKW
jgi:glucose-1-phosphate cytidylyltransferase